MFISNLAVIVKPCLSFYYYVFVLYIHERACMYRDFPTFSKQGPGTNDFGKNNTYISQIGKMDTKTEQGIICIFGVNLRIFL